MVCVACAPRARARLGRSVAHILGCGAAAACAARGGGTARRSGGAVYREEGKGWARRGSGCPTYPPPFCSGGRFGGERGWAGGVGGAAAPLVSQRALRRPPLSSRPPRPRVHSNQRQYGKRGGEGLRGGVGGGVRGGGGGLGWGLTAGGWGGVFPAPAVRAADRSGCGRGGGWVRGGGRVGVCCTAVRARTRARPAGALPAGRASVALSPLPPPSHNRVPSLALRVRAHPPPGSVPSAVVGGVVAVVKGERGDRAICFTPR